MDARLPEKFRDLERWSQWILPTEVERYALRARTDLDELKVFCAALTPHIHDLIQYLSAFEWGTPLSAEDQNLYHLGLSFMEASVPVDLGWPRSIARDSFPVGRIAMAERG